MRAQLVVGRVGGVSIGVHSSWLVLAALVVSSLAGHFSMSSPQWGARLIWTTAAVTALALFASLVLHELAHAAVARSRGIRVQGITLFLLGGVSEIQQEPGDPKTEAWMGLAGPLASAVIATLSWAAAEALGPQSEPLPAGQLFALTGAANAALALFNLIPGFPLDGGRVLRAALWGYSGDFVRSTQLAARAGQAVAALLLALGAGRVVTGSGIGGLWSALLGWYLLEAATASYVQADLRRLLDGVRVRELMKPVAVVESCALLRAVVDASLVHDGSSQFVVVAEKGRPVGLVSALEVARVPRIRWPDTTVGQAMRALDPQDRLSPDTPAAEALERMTRGRFHCLPVTESGRISGVLTRAKLLHALETRRLL